MTVTKDFQRNAEHVEDKNKRLSLGGDLALSSKPLPSGESEELDFKALKIADKWHDLKERVNQGDPDLRVNSSTVKYLAFSAAESIMEHNFKLRDNLRKWIRDLESEIQFSAQSRHTLHLYEFSKFATTYVAELKAVAACLAEVVDRSDHQSSIGTAATAAVLKSSHASSVSHNPHQLGSHAKSDADLIRRLNFVSFFCRCI